MLNFLANSWRSILIVIGGLVANAVLRKAVHVGVRRFDDEDPTTVSAREQRAQTLGNVLNTVGGIAIWGIVFVTLLSEWGLDITPLITGAGILGLAIGFGTQTLVKDMIGGFFILLENQFNEGDTIEAAGLKGKVKKISLRTIIMKDREGNTLIIPNSQVTKVMKFSGKKSTVNSE